jgi:hypothetical protein
MLGGGTLRQRRFGDWLPQGFLGSSLANVWDGDVVIIASREQGVAKP